jgi:hypothetical protein
MVEYTDRDRRILGRMRHLLELFTARECNLRTLVDQLEFQYNSLDVRTDVLKEKWSLYWGGLEILLATYGDNFRNGDMIKKHLVPLENIIAELSDSGKSQ